MPNSGNLRIQSSTEARRNGKTGGIRSGQERRRRRQLCDDLRVLLESPAPGSAETCQHEICIALIAKALKGDTKAFEIIRDTVGEKPAERITLAQIDQTTIDEVEKMVLGQE